MYFIAGYVPVFVRFSRLDTTAACPFSTRVALTFLGLTRWEKSGGLATVRLFQSPAPTHTFSNACNFIHFMEHKGYPLSQSCMIMGYFCFVLIPNEFICLLSPRLFPLYYVSHVLSKLANNRNWADKAAFSWKYSNFSTFS